MKQITNKEYEEWQKYKAEKAKGHVLLPDTVRFICEANGYNPDLMKLYVVGGGSCLIKNFAEYDPARVTINGDICATAKGYELLAAGALGRKGNA